MQPRLVLVYIILLYIAVFFVSRPVGASGSSIVISEIAAYEQSGCEWIEIVNVGPVPVSMEGWKFVEGGANHGLKISSSSQQQADWVIEPAEYAIIVQNDAKLLSGAGCRGTYSAPAGMLFDSSWSTLNEGGESVGIKDAGGSFVEQFAYISAKNFSLERKNLYTQDYTNINWQEHPDGNSFGRQNYWFLTNTAPLTTPSPSSAPASSPLLPPPAPPSPSPSPYSSPSPTPESDTSAVPLPQQSDFFPIAVASPSSSLSGLLRPRSEASRGSDDTSLASSSAEISPVEESKSASQKQKTTVTPLHRVSALKAGSTIVTRGVVAVLPGVFGSQYFYLVNLPSLPSAALQAYQHNKSFPKFGVGDEVEAHGVLSRVRGETRLKVASADDLTVKKRGGAPEPMLVSISMVSSTFSRGGLARVEGELLEKKGDTWHIADGGGELRVSWKKGAEIGAPPVEAGDKVNVAGVLRWMDSGAELLPRGENDVKKLVSEPLPVELSSSTSLFFADGRGIRNYLLASAAGLFMILVALATRIRKNRIVSEKREADSIDNSVIH